MLGTDDSTKTSQIVIAIFVIVISIASLGGFAYYFIRRCRKLEEQKQQPRDEKG